MTNEDTKLLVAKLHQRIREQGDRIAELKQALHEDRGLLSASLQTHQAAIGFESEFDLDEDDIAYLEDLISRHHEAIARIDALKVVP